MRINKYIAENSGFSRRKADELIEQKKVFINGKIAKLGDTVNPETDKITITKTQFNPKQSNKEKNFFYFAINKPRGYISTRADEMDRKTVLDLVPRNLNLKPVGRLDKDTEGLLLLSNDGEFINRLTHPRYECEKEYMVIVEGSPTHNTIQTLQEGIRIEGIKTSSAKITIKKTAEKQTTLRITIHEGRKRQIRKMFASVNHPVKYLKRIRIGNIRLANLPIGKFRTLTPAEINAYKSP